jgi:hypothetical protein
MACFGSDIEMMEFTAIFSASYFSTVSTSVSLLESKYRFEILTQFANTGERPSLHVWSMRQTKNLSKSLDTAKSFSTLIKI